MTTSEAQRRDFWQQAGEKFNEITGGSIFQFQRRAKPTGLLKMKVRVIEYENHEAFLNEPANKPTNLRKLYAEQQCRIRVHVYTAERLAPRPNGKPPEPYLKVYNRIGHERTTRDIPTPPSLDPDFYASFELAAVLPGESRLHIEVWDFQLLSQTLLGQVQSAARPRVRASRPRPDRSPAPTALPRSPPLPGADGPGLGGPLLLGRVEEAAGRGHPSH